MNIPNMLKIRPNWVVWGVENAPLKAPYTPLGLLVGYPTLAKAGVPSTWGIYETAVDCVAKGLAQGIGYEFEGNYLYGIDLDNVFDEHGSLFPEAESIVNQLNSYTEISPSGTGLHILVLAPDVDITRHRKKDHFLEVYNKGRYFTVTGNVYKEQFKIEIRAQELQSIHDTHLLTDVVQEVPVPLSVLQTPSESHDESLRVGLERDRVLAELWSGRRRCSNESANDMALMRKLAYWCNADVFDMIQAFLSSPHYAQKDEAHIKKCQRHDYLQNTAQKAVIFTHSTAISDSAYKTTSHPRDRDSVR